MNKEYTRRYIDAKDDKRPCNNGWCPGSYTCTCAVCRDIFIGDKRAVVCADCAYKKDQNNDKN